MSTALDGATVAALADASGLSADAVRYWVPRLPPSASDPAVRAEKLRAIAELRPPDSWYAKFARDVAEFAPTIPVRVRRTTIATTGRIVHRRIIVCASCGEERAHAGRGLCGTCHARETRAGTIEDWPVSRQHRNTR